MRELGLYQHESAPCAAVEEGPEATLDPGCKGCKLHERAHSVCLKPELTGPETGPTLYVLGPPPGQVEDSSGRPMVGQTGGYVRQLLGRSWSGRIVYDVALRCAPGREELKPAMFDACRPYTRRAFGAAGADRVLLLGREAMVMFLGEGFQPLSVRRGYTQTSDGVPVFLLPVPAAALRNRFHRGWLEEDLEWALTATPEPPPRGGVVAYVEDRADLELALGELELAPWTTWDCETYGAPHNREFAILNVALTPGGLDMSYSLERSALEQFGPELAHWLATHPSGGHGVKYDAVAMKRVFGGPWIKADFDTMALRRYYESDVELALESTQAAVGMTGGKGALKYVKHAAAQLRKAAKGPTARTKLQPLEEYWYSSEDPETNRAEWQQAVDRIAEGDEAERYAYAGIPPEVRGGYNALDTVSTDRVRRRYGAMQDEESVRARRVWEQVGRSMNHALTVMEYNGIKPDPVKIAELVALCDRDIQAIEQAVVAQFGRAFNFHAGSNDTGILLFDLLGLPAVGGMTASGKKRKCDEETLSKLDNEWADKVIQWRKRKHFKAQYAEGMLRFTRDDGRIHTSFKVFGTVTGRPSTEDPNLFNLPRLDAADGSGKLCRDVFIAEEGWDFLEADQSQVELRVAGMLSGDERMIQVYKDGKDIHLEAARMTAPLFKLRPEDIDSEHPHRSNTKSVVFGALYGEPEGALAKKLGISRAKAKQLQDGIFGHYRQLKAWIQEQVLLARKTGQCHTWWQGQKFRRRSLTDVAGHDEARKVTAERSAYNTPIQGCRPGSARVLTSQGYLRFDEAPRVGWVWTGTAWAEYELLDRGEWELAELELGNGHTHLCDTRHSVLVARETGYEFSSYPELQPGDRVCLSLATPLEFGADSVLEHAYWLGFSTGNGSTGRNGVSICFGDRIGRYSKEQKAAEWCAYARSLGVEPQRARVEVGKISVTVEGRAFRSLWESLGYVWGARARVKRVPASLWRGSLAVRRAFLLGLLDADGSVGSGAGPCPNLHMCQAELLSEVQLLLRHVGVESTLRGPYGLTAAYRLDLNGAQAARALGYGAPRSKLTVPGQPASRFVVEALLAALPTCPSTSPSHRTLWHRLRSGGTTSVYTVAELARVYGVALGVPLYAHTELVGKQALGRRERTYTLSVRDSGHRFDSEGVITKNTAADYTNASLGAIQEWLDTYPEGQEPARSVLTVYDSILLEVRLGQRELVARKVKSIMEGWPTLHGMPLRSDLKVGTRYGSLVKYKLPEPEPEPEVVNG